MNEMNNAVIHQEEKIAPHTSGMVVLLLNLLLILLSAAVLVFGILWVNIPMIVASSLYLFVICFFPFAGLKVLKPNEALVLTLFGEYYGTLRGPGFYCVNPFATALNPAAKGGNMNITAEQAAANPALAAEYGLNAIGVSKKISLKTMTLNNNQQKINDQLGNPIIIGIVVIWRVVNTAKAVFSVNNYPEFLSIQCDSALRNIVRLYPYDTGNGDDSDNEKSLRGSSQEIAGKLQAEIQSKVDVAGLEIIEARITHLAYAPEIAAAMLQRQQASAVIDARQMIVDGAVGMVEMALQRLNENNIVQLDEERKAAMVSNLLVVLCGNKDAQPIVNSGSLY